MTDTISPHVKAYLRRIGAKGGRAQKGTPQRRELNTRAAEIRWRKLHPKPQTISAEEIAEKNSA